MCSSSSVGLGNSIGNQQLFGERSIYTLIGKILGSGDGWDPSFGSDPWYFQVRGGLCLRIWTFQGWRGVELKQTGERKQRGKKKWETAVGPELLLWLPWDCLALNISRDGASTKFSGQPGPHHPHREESFLDIPPKSALSLIPPHPVTPCSWK